MLAAVPTVSRRARTAAFGNAGAVSATRTVRMHSDGPTALRTRSTTSWSPAVAAVSATRS